MTNLPVHYIVRDDGEVITLEGMSLDPGWFRGELACLTVVDEHLDVFWSETNLQHPKIDTVRTIVAKHLPDNEPLPKRNWLQRWLTNPEPDEQPIESRIVTIETPLRAEDMRERFEYVETPHADSLVSRLNEAHLDAIAKERKQAARDGVFVAARHLQRHLANLSNETSSDTIVRAATRDCIEVLRELHRKMGEAPSGGA